MNNVYAYSEKPFSVYDQVFKILDARHARTILDIGCNNGYVGEHYPTAEFYGIEKNAACAARSRNVGYKQVITADLDSFTPPQLSTMPKFDAILILDVLEHLIRPATVLDLLKPYLKEGGVFIISLPNIAEIRMRLSLLLGRFNYTDKGTLDRTHLHFYTAQTAKALIEEAGCHIISINFRSVFFKNLIWDNTILGTLLALGFIIVAKK
jgi:2-polyprenyl-3-methyl-5-hydroxy-6-metoxy-1,4-benzoquinol methylase